MSEPIRESIPTSFSKRSDRPTKRRAIETPTSQQSAQVEALFANPDRADNVVAVGPKPKIVAAPPEIVANVQGSSAGAGSGEFHVYKASRRREYERLRAMDEETRVEEAEREFKEKKEERERADEEKLSKNRAKREKAKARAKKKAVGDGEKNGDGESKAHGGQSETMVKKKLVTAKVASTRSEQNTLTDVATPDSASEAVDEGANGGVMIHDDD